MSHFTQYQGNANSPDNRTLGDEWVDWDGQREVIREGKGLFLGASATIVVALILISSFFAYLITPRLAGWHHLLPPFIWLGVWLFSILIAVWFALLALTVFTGRNFLLSRKQSGLLFDLTFAGAFRLAKVLNISRDRMGHSFVRLSNEITKAFKKRDGEERLLLLLPRCLVKEELAKINALKETYPINIHTVSGGELARRKVVELKPTAVIGVACERDLVSGIRDVGSRLSVIGIPNHRPDGPCKDTHIDMDELISAIEFYVGPPRKSRQ